MDHSPVQIREDGLEGVIEEVKGIGGGEVRQSRRGKG